jgi:hypothetical protein
MITNAAFLSTVFSKTPDGASAWVAKFAEDPHVADRRRCRVLDAWPVRRPGFLTIRPTCPRCGARMPRR